MPPPDPQNRATQRPAMVDPLAWTRLAPAWLTGPIHRAAWEGNAEEVARLMEADPRLLNARVPRSDSSRDEGHTALIVAAHMGHEAVVERLLALGADTEVRCVMYGCTAAFDACLYQHARILSLLLDAGACITARAHSGETLLMIAASDFGGIECVRLLLARGGNALELLDAQEAEDGWTALHHAARTVNPAMLQLLLQAGANPTIRDAGDWTPLDVAREQLEECLKEDEEYPDFLECCEECMQILEAAMAEPDRPRALLKARALMDAVHAVEKARSNSNARTRAGRIRAAVAAAPVYLKGRMGEGQQLPQVEVVEGED